MDVIIRGEDIVDQFGEVNSPLVVFLYCAFMCLPINRAHDAFSPRVHLRQGI